jgi:hypothetical protein
MAHSPGPTTLVGSTDCSEEPHDHSTQQEPARPPQRWPRPSSACAVLHCGFLAQSSQPNSAETIPRPPQKAAFHSLVPSLPTFLYASAQSGPGQPDQIPIACARGPRFRATKVSATPLRVSVCRQLPTWRRRNLTVTRNARKSSPQLPARRHRPRRRGQGCLGMSAASITALPFAG